MAVALWLVGVYVAVVVFGTLALQALVLAVRVGVWVLTVAAFVVLLPFAALEVMTRRRALAGAPSAR